MIGKLIFVIGKLMFCWLLWKGLEADVTEEDVVEVDVTEGKVVLVVGILVLKQSNTALVGRAIEGKRG